MCPYRVMELCARVPLTIEGSGTLAARTASPGSSALEHCSGKVPPARVHVHSRRSLLGSCQSGGPTTAAKAGCHWGQKTTPLGLLRSNGEIEPPHVHVGLRSFMLGVPSTRGASHRRAGRAPYGLEPPRRGSSAQEHRNIEVAPWGASQHGAASGS
jgi:hypothetical protein